MIGQRGLYVIDFLAREGFMLSLYGIGWRGLYVEFVSDWPERALC